MTIQGPINFHAAEVLYHILTILAPFCVSLTSLLSPCSSTLAMKISQFLLFHTMLVEVYKREWREDA